jgi:hypothetical protein
MTGKSRSEVQRKALNKKQQVKNAKPGGKKKPVLKPGGGRGTK